MVKNPDLLSRFNAALGRLQSKGRDLRSDRQKQECNAILRLHPRIFPATLTNTHSMMRRMH